MLKTCWTNKRFAPGSWTFPATIKRHKTAIPPVMNILSLLSIIIASLPSPSGVAGCNPWLTQSRYSGTYFGVCARRLNREFGKQRDKTYFHGRLRGIVKDDHI